MKWEIRWIDAWADENGEWVYNETRHVAEIEVDSDEDAKDKAIAKLRDWHLDPLDIAAGRYRWSKAGDGYEIVERRDGCPRFCLNPID